MRRLDLCATLALLLVATAVAAAPQTAQDDYASRMEREHAEDAPVATPGAETAPAGAVTGGDVTYARLAERDVRGYVARPSGASPSAGILLIHEWWGLNDNIRGVADRLAGEGYVALAVDLYEGEVATDRERASALMRTTLERTDALEDNLRQAYRHLVDHEGVSAVGVIGWCFGGGWSLRTALLLGDRIGATVIYYGRLTTDREALATLASPILGIFGGLDQGIPVATVREFEHTLSSLGRTARIHVYPDADHAFANPSGRRYKRDAAADAWAKTLAFFAEHLR